MNKIKKLLSLGLVVASVAGSLLQATAVAEEYSVQGETVLYYNAFPNGGVLDHKEVCHEQYYFYGANKDLGKIITNDKEFAHALDDTCAGVKGNYNRYYNAVESAEWNGDSGIKLPANTAISNTPVGLFDFRYSDIDKTPSINPEGLTEGKYKLSFEFVNSGSGTTDNMMVMANCYHGNCADSFLKLRATEWFVFKGTRNWDNDAIEKNIPTTTGELHKYELIFDLDNDEVHTYMDGVKHTTGKYTKNIKFLFVLISGKIVFFDDLEFTKLDDEVEFDAVAEKADKDGITVTLNDYITNVADLIAEITDVYSGEKIDSEIVAKTSKSFEVASKNSELIAGREYKVLISNINTMRGDGGDVSAVVNFGEQNCIKKLTVNDFYGNKNSFATDEKAEISGYTFEFSEDVDAKEALKALSLKDSEGNNVAFEVAETEKTNVAKVNFLPSIKGLKTYTMSLEGMSIPYEWTFTTRKGKITLKPIELYDAEDEKITVSDIAAGDKITAKVSLVNTGDLTSEYPIVLTTGLYNGSSLNGADFEELVITPEKDSFQKDIEFTVSDITDLKIKAFMWKNLGSGIPVPYAIQTN